MRLASGNAFGNVIFPAGETIGMAAGKSEEFFAWMIGPTDFALNKIITSERADRGIFHGLVGGYANFGKHGGGNLGKVLEEHMLVPILGL